MDTHGRSRFSSPVEIAVNDAPVVTLTISTNGSIYPVPLTNITVSATATDPGGSIVQVEFFCGTNSLGVDSDSPYSVVWSSVPAGNYHVWARVTNNEGARAASDSAVITVLPTNSPPFIFAGSNLTIRFPTNSQLHGLVTDDGLPSGILTSLWQRISGAGNVSLFAFRS